MCSIICWILPNPFLFLTIKPMLHKDIQIHAYKNFIFEKLYTDVCCSWSAGMTISSKNPRVTINIDKDKACS